MEVTLDDCWTLDLNKRDRWRLVLPGTMRDLVWKGDIDDDGSEMTGEGGSDDDGDSDESDPDNVSEDEGSGAEGEVGARGRDKKSRKQGAQGEGEGGHLSTKTKKGSKGRVDGRGGGLGVRAEVQSLRESLPGRGEDDRQFPLYGEAVGSSQVSGGGGLQAVESLRDFYRCVCLCLPVHTSVYLSSHPLPVNYMSIIL